VILTAVSVVICSGPRCREGNPGARSLPVRSRGGSSPNRRYVSLLIRDSLLQDLPRIPPNRKASNFDSSSGESPRGAFGSRRQTLSDVISRSLRTSKIEDSEKDDLSGSTDSVDCTRFIFRNSIDFRGRLEKRLS
jgi:hypothetical protein